MLLYFITDIDPIKNDANHLIVEFKCDVFRGIIRMTVGSPHLNTFSYRVRRKIFESSRRWDSLYTTLQASYKQPMSTVQCYFCCNKNTVLRSRVLRRNITAHVIKTVR